MTSSTGFEFPEPLIAAILGQAIKEGRAAELWEVLTAGGSATIDAQTGKLVTASAEALEQMWNRPPEKKRPGPKPNAEGCQSRLYGRWGVHAKCWLTHDNGSDPDEHSNGYRRWTTAESVATAARFRTGRVSRDR